MRTPNTKCVICGKPLYRRPFELKRVRYVACYTHREDAKWLFGVTSKQEAALSLGRVKGTNHLEDIPKSAESNRKRSESQRQFLATHLEVLKARGEKIRGDRHYRWNGGSSRLNASIRLMQEHRKWMQAVKERDGFCVVCGTADKTLEAHHLTPFADLLERHSIRTHSDARACTALWDLGNGQTLCQRHHYEVHGRTYAD